ncbi:MAG: pectate lyase [Woeseiaceae bacterium]
MGGDRKRISRRQLLLGTGAAALTGACSRFKSGTAEAAGDSDLGGKALVAMRRAMAFMRESCAVNGGYVWSYAADFSRRWGEMEAYPSMIWIQPPGTATVGHLYLDCLHATGDAGYYAAAAEVADGLIAAQHPTGGWNYLHDFAGEASVRRWYDTIGKNGWRLEEFHHYYGNATFDDAGTADATQFLLRVYLEKREQRFEAPLGRAVNFMLDSQYDNGGWPQRFPFVDDMPALHGHPDYTRLITFNDDVGAENIKTLLMVWQTLGDERALAAIRRAMGVFSMTQQPAPQAGWGLQHHVDDLSPAGARSYEPEALVTHTTASNVRLMLDFCEWTGEKAFLERIPEALDWLESVRLPAGEVRIPGREYPTFIEIGSNRAIYNHRRGSNVVNGEYYQDYSPEHPIVHYSQWRAIDADALRERHAQLNAASTDALAATSPLAKKDNFALPTYFTARNIEVSDLNSDAGQAPFEIPDEARVREFVDGLDAQGRWLTPLTATSHPYSGPGPATPAPGDYSETRVGDASDTSPYITDRPAIGISTGRFIQNMSALMQYVAGDGIDKSHGKNTQGNSD